MDAYEATRVVFSRIQSLDPENAPKIMGLLLIQDHGEKEMIRLAFGPESLVQSVVIKARKELGLLPSPYSSSSSLYRHNSSRLGPLSPTITVSPSWLSSSASAFSRNGSDDLQSPDELISPSSYTTSGINFVSSSSSSCTSSSSSSSSAQELNNGLFYGDMIDELHLQDQLSFLNDPSSSPNSAHSLPIGPKNEFFYPNTESRNPTSSNELLTYANWANGTNPLMAGGTLNGHRRSCSVADICLASESGSGFAWKPCLYFARGYCKNGSSCRFLHGFPDSPRGTTPEVDAIVGSAAGKLEVEQCHELLMRSKSQRLPSASQLIDASFPYAEKFTGKCMFPTENYLQNNDSQRLQQNTLFQLGEDGAHKFSRSRVERNEFGGGIATPGSRQIYLTFPADSTFREEDVSNYFSIYGPVQDVRIPYQQKRMFGFVTFMYPETVKIILAKGNPHFVCDARVLVKPYKEKGKVGDKYRKHATERGEFSAPTTPNCLDSRDAYDLQLGAKLFYISQEALRRKLEEEAGLQQAIELQGRRLMGLQLLDLKKRQLPCRIVPANANQFNQCTTPCDGSGETPPEDNCPSPATVASDQQVNYDLSQQQEAVISATSYKEPSNGIEERPKEEENDFQESFEHNLPDNPFASPTKTLADSHSIFSSATNVGVGVSNNLITSPLLPATSTLDMASFKSCFFQMPRFSSDPGAIGM